MKIEITIADENGIILEQVLADTADSPHPDDENAAARWILDNIENFIDCEDA